MKKGAPVRHSNSARLTAPKSLYHPQNRYRRRQPAQYASDFPAGKPTCCSRQANHPPTVRLNSLMGAIESLPQRNPFEFDTLAMQLALEN
jgi:hypothetical protein